MISLECRRDFWHQKTSHWAIVWRYLPDPWHFNFLALFQYFHFVTFWNMLRWPLQVKLSRVCQCVIGEHKPFLTSTLIIEYENSSYSRTSRAEIPYLVLPTFVCCYWFGINSKYLLKQIQMSNVQIFNPHSLSVARPLISQNKTIQRTPADQSDLSDHVLERTHYKRVSRGLSCCKWRHIRRHIYAANFLTSVC